MNIINIMMLLLTTTSFAIAQRVKVSKVSNQEIIHFANNFTSVSEQKTNLFAVRIIKVTSGVSPYAQDTGEVDHFLYIATSEYGEGINVIQNLYKIGPFFHPSSFSLGKDPKLKTEFLVFSYLANEKKIGFIYLYIDKIEFSETAPKPK